MGSVFKSAATFAGLASLAESILPRVSIPSIKLGISLPLNNNTSEQPKSLQEFLEENHECYGEHSEIDAGILKAAPKKKVSHMKRRQKLYAPGDKQIKLKNNLNRCPACGNYKRSHFLCMHCVGQIRKYWKQRDTEAPAEPEQFVNPKDEQVIYPGKTEREYERKLKSKDWLLKRPKTLPVE